MKLVEGIPNLGTQPTITNEIIDYVKKIGKTPILCKKDVVGFIVNRVFIPLVNELLIAWTGTMFQCQK